MDNSILKVDLGIPYGIVIFKLKKNSLNRDVIIYRSTAPDFRKSAHPYYYITYEECISRFERAGIFTSDDYHCWIQADELTDRLSHLVCFYRNLSPGRQLVMDTYVTKQAFLEAYIALLVRKKLIKLPWEVWNYILEFYIT